MLYLALLTIVATFIFYPTFQTDFFSYDDQTFITHNPYINQGLNYKSLRWSFLGIESAGYQLSSDLPNYLYQPVYWLALQLEVHFFGLNPLGFRLTSLLLHLANTYLVLQLCTKVIQLSSARALVVVTIFCLHPAQVENVAWITEQKELLAALFGLLALTQFNYSPTATKKQQLPSIALMALAVLSKPSAVVLPILLLLIIWGKTNKKFNFKSLSAEGWKFLKRTPEFIILSIFISIVTLYKSRIGVTEDHPIPNTFLDRMIDLPCVFVNYIKLVFFKIDRAIKYSDWTQSMGKYEIPVSICILIIGLISIAFIIYCANKRTALGCLWFIAALLPVLGFSYVTDSFTNDRYLYIPIVGIGILLVSLLSSRLKVWSYHVIILCVMLLLSLCSLPQAHIWKNEVTLFKNLQHEEPTLPLSYINLGAIYLNRGDYPEAEKQLIQGLKIKPDSLSGTHALALCKMMLGKSQDAQLLLLEIVKRRPNLSEGWIKLALLQQKTGILSKYSTEECFIKGNEVSSWRDPQALSAYAIYLMENKKPEHAASLIETLKSVAPISPFLQRALKLQSQ